MLNLVGGAPPLGKLAAIAGARVHLYRKQPRPGRKFGHVTLPGAGAEDSGRRLGQLRDLVDAHTA